MSETEKLRQDLERARSQLTLMAEELEETNRGVVALYAELDNQAIQLREAADMKSRFLAYLSHEFRTPLGAIRGMARLLLDHLDGELNAEQDKQVRLMLGSATELSQMVDDLLDLSKVEAGRITVSPAWFDMVDLFTALRGMFKPLLGSEITLVLEKPVGVERVYSDDQKVTQILRNYISNAIKFTPRGEVRVTARRVGDNVRFAVTDTGIGIAREHLPLLFRDYSQLPIEGGRALRGTGLGLSVCLRFAQLLGGSVGVESELGKGSTFYAELPITYQGPAPAPQEAT